MVLIAQLVRALDCGSKGRGFESHSSPTLKRLSEPDSLFLSWFFRIYMTSGKFIAPFGEGVMFSFISDDSYHSSDLRINGMNLHSITHTLVGSY